ncbi:hypothetical protein SUDANB96_06421 [Streptomyces sp. enrichment culture]
MPVILHATTDNAPDVRLLAAPDKAAQGVVSGLL